MSMTNEVSQTDLAPALKEAISKIEQQKVELEALKQERHQLRNELTAARLEKDQLGAAIDKIAASCPSCGGHGFYPGPEGERIDCDYCAPLRSHLSPAHEPGAAPELKCPCGVAYLRVEGSYVPVCDCAAKNSVAIEPSDDLGNQIYALLVRRGYAQHEAHLIADGPGCISDCVQKGYADIDCPAHGVEKKSNQDGQQAPAPSGNAGLGTAGGASSLHQSSVKSTREPGVSPWNPTTSTDVSIHDQTPQKSAPEPVSAPVEYVLEQRCKCGLIWRVHAEYGFRVNQIFCACGKKIYIDRDAVKSAPEPSDGYSQAYADQMRTALLRISLPVFINSKPAYADPDNVKTICDGLNERIKIAQDALLGLGKKSGGGQ